MDEPSGNVKIKKRTNTYAAGSLILAVVSFFVFVNYSKPEELITLVIVFALSLPSIILGFMARSEIKSKNEGGKSIAIAGIIIGFFLSFLVIMGFWVSFSPKEYTLQPEIIEEPEPVVEPEVADEKEVIEVDYKNSVLNISYNDLIRYNEEYQFKFVYFKGRINQVIEKRDGKFTIFLATKKDMFGDYFENIVVVYYEGERLLEGDIIEVWGKTCPLDTFERVMGGEETFPCVNSIELNMIKKVE